MSTDTELDYEGWMEALRALKGRYTLAEVDQKAFAGSVRSKTIFGLDAVDIRGDACRAERTRRDVRLDDFDSYYAVFQIAGSSTVIRNDVASHLRVGDVALVDSTRPVTYISECGRAQWISLVLPRQEFISHSGFEPRHLPVQSGMTTAGRLLFQLVSNFGQETDLSGPACSCMQLAIFDLLGALTAPYIEQTNSSQYSDKLFARVCDVMRGRFRDPDINPQEVAAEVGISLRYLQKLFTTRNSTYSHLLTSLRLDHAAHLLRRRALTKSGQPLSTIAYACGYRDYAHFARSFRKHFGHVPSASQNDDAPGTEVCAVRSSPEQSAH